MVKYNSQADLLRMINQLSFALDETRLYLDTHPRCEKGLSYFKKMQHLRREAVEEYEKNFGPICPYEIDRDAKTWKWNQSPWPWEYEFMNGGGC